VPCRLQFDEQPRILSVVIEHFSNTNLMDIYTEAIVPPQLPFLSCFLVRSTPAPERHRQPLAVSPAHHDLHIIAPSFAQVPRFVELQPHASNNQNLLLPQEIQRFQANLMVNECFHSKRYFRENSRVYDTGAIVQSERFRYHVN
jgi:hypothetical protein